MKTKIHPGVFAAVLIVVLIGAGLYLKSAFSSGVVGVTYAPGQAPKSHEDPSMREAAEPRDVGKSGVDLDGK
jgi:hypothetical protein